MRLQRLVRTPFRIAHMFDVVRTSRPGAVGAVACVALTMPLHAQSPIIVSDAHRCTTCRLALRRVVSLGKLSDPELIDELRRPSVQHDSRGRFFVASSKPRTEILVYDNAGSCIEAWGRAGDGPGEFRSVQGLYLLPADSLLVVDLTGRITVLDADGHYARSHPIQMRPRDIALLPSGEMIIAATVYTAERIGYPLHRVRADGEIEADFGGEHSVLLSRPSAARRVIAAAGSGAWAARPDRYEIEYWAVAGRRTTLLDRVCDWFPDRNVEGAGSAEEPPSPYLVDLYVDRDGLLWTLSIIADADWQPGDGRVTGRWNRVFDSIVEVIDPRSGELLASKRLPWYGYQFTNDGLIVSHRNGPYESVVLDVWRGSLTRDEKESAP